MRPLAESRLAILSSARLVLPGQQPFDKSVRGGDVSFRKIPSRSRAEVLVDTHRSRSFDHAGLQKDPNPAFPIDRFRELTASGGIGSLAREHLSFMGSITAPGRLVRDAAPEMARCLLEDSVDAVLLVPV